MSQFKLYLYSAEGKDSAANKWDYGLLKEFCEKKNIEQVNVTSLEYSDKAFVAIPGPSNAGLEEKISRELNNIKKVVLFILGDEAALFDADKIVHPNISIWIQYPHDKHQRYNKFPQGVPQHFKQYVSNYKTKDIDLYFSGQVNHNRRRQLSKVLPSIPNATYKFTEGFTQGDTPDIYYNNMSRSKFVPCPSGIVVLDSFRFYEALELLCYPIVDSTTPKEEKSNYFGPLFNQTMPIVAVDYWEDLPNLMVNLYSNYPDNMHQAVSWWIKFKRDLFNKIMEDINE